MKNSKLFLLLSFLLLLLLLFGCSQDAKENQIDFDLIGSEKTLPATFNEISFKSKGTSYVQILVRRVNNLANFEDTWKLYELKKNPPSINFKEKDIYFIGLYESGSCPYEISGIQWASGNKTMKVSLASKNGACTADATPRTVAIQVDRTISKEIESVSIIEGRTETEIPLD